jgi:methionyl-tRNA formyltransferase
VLEAAPARDAAPLAPGTVALDGRRVLVGTGDAPVELITVQPAGRTPMPAAAWLRGARPPVRLG